MKNVDSCRAGEHPPLVVPTTLSDLPTIRAKLDPDSTLPMEPVMLAELCAQTQVSGRRHTLPRGLEYSVHVQTAFETPPTAAAVSQSAAELAASTAERQRWGRLQRRQTLMLILGPCLGMSLGMGMAWQLGLGKPGAARRSTVTSTAAPVTQAGNPATARFANAGRLSGGVETPAAPAGSVAARPSGLAGPPSQLVTSATALVAGPPTLLALPTASKVVPANTSLPATLVMDSLVIAAGPVLVHATRPPAAHLMPVGARKPSRSGSPPLAAAPAFATTPSESEAPPAELPAAELPRSETTALPEKPAAPPSPTRPAVELDHGRTPRLLSGSKPQLPTLVRQMYRHEAVVGTYRVCVQPSGTVASVTAVSGIPFDEEIRRTLHSWRFAPRATPACVDQELHFEVDE